MADATASTHFPASEFACRCGCGSEGADPRLVEGLELLRSAIGAPVHVISGCRCDKHNTAVGGTPNSTHRCKRGEKTRGADITTYKIPMIDLFRAADKIPQFSMGGIGIYPKRGFIHVDIRGVRTRWGKVGAKYTPFAEAWEELKKEEVVA